MARKTISIVDHAGHVDKDCCLVNSGDDVVWHSNGGKFKVRFDHSENPFPKDDIDVPDKGDSQSVAAVNGQHGRWYRYTVQGAWRKENDPIILID